MESHSGQKWSRLFLRSSFWDNKPRCHSIRRDTNPPFENLILIFQDLFLWVENFFADREVFLLVENFLAGRDFFFTGREFLNWSRIFCPVENVIFCLDNQIGECRRGSPVNCRGSDIRVTITTAVKIFLDKN